ncbi:MAG: hypothetical protein WBG48_08560 [Pricia sp.]
MSLNTRITVIFFLIIMNISCSNDDNENSDNTITEVVGIVDVPASCNTNNGNQAYQIIINESSDNNVIVTANLPEEFQEENLEIQFDMITSSEDLTMCTTNYLPQQFKKITNITLNN